MSRGSWKAAAAAAVLFVLGAAPAHAADGYTVTAIEVDTVVGPDDNLPCRVVGDLYTPDGASAANRMPALLMTNGFGGSKADQAPQAKYFAKRGYVVLSYSGLGFGGSACKITLDDRDYDGKAGSQLLTYLAGLDTVKLDAPGDPRAGMIGGSYGGQIQFAVAGIDRRLDTIIPLITWNDLSYSLAPNNTSFLKGVTYGTPGVAKNIWQTLFFALGIVRGFEFIGEDFGRVVGGCPNFDDRVCAAKLQMDATGAPNETTLALSRHASVADFIEQIRIPTLIGQGQKDTLFNLQEAVATYRALKAQGTPVKMIWHSWGHSGGSARGDYDGSWEKGGYENTAFTEWFDHYLKGDPKAPSLDFTFHRPWVKVEGDDATAAYGRAAAYPIGATEKLMLSGDGTLRGAAERVQDGATMLTTTALGAPASYTEISAVDPGNVPFDLPGTTAVFTSAPLERDLDVAGVPRVRMRVQTPVHALTGSIGAPGEVVLFVRLQRVAADGSVTLPNKLISPIRIANPSVPVDVELPGIVERFAKGERLQLIVAGGDLAYRGNVIAGPVSILTDARRPGLLELPVVREGDHYGPVVRAGSCSATKRITVRIPKRYRGKVREARVTVGKRRVATLRGKRTSARVTLRGRGTQTVRTVLRLRNGKRVTLTRRHRLSC